MVIPSPTGESRRRIVVVGAGSGIGAATAEHFHCRGDHVLAVDVKPNRGLGAESRQCDLRNAGDITALLEELPPNWDLLAYIAGLPGTAPADDVLLVNYLGMRLMVEGMLPRMRRGGAIVTVASTAAVGWEQRADALAGLLDARDADQVRAWQATQDPQYPVYSTSKQAAIIYSRRLAGVAWSTYGVRVNTISPGPVHTPILPEFEKSMGKGALDMARDTVGRHGTVDDIVPVIDFLGSPQARWINGQDIHVDAGFITSLLAGSPIALAHQPN